MCARRLRIRNRDLAPGGTPAGESATGIALTTPVGDVVDDRLLEGSLFVFDLRVAVGEALGLDVVQDDAELLARLAETGLPRIKAGVVFPARTSCLVSGTY